MFSRRACSPRMFLDTRRANSPAQRDRRRSCGELIQFPGYIDNQFDVLSIIWCNGRSEGVLLWSRLQLLGKVLLASDRRARSVCSDVPTDLVSVCCVSQKIAAPTI